VSGAIRCLKASSSRWEVVNPAAKLEWLSQTVYSSTQNTAVRPLLSDRDKFPDGSREYEYILEYCFKAPQAGDVIVRFPLLNQMIYESVFGSQFYMLYDSQKRLIGTGDAHPEAIKLTAVGDYLV
jgi:tripeptidyl-peptidase II